MIVIDAWLSFFVAAVPDWVDNERLGDDSGRILVPNMTCTLRAAEHNGAKTSEKFLSKRECFICRFQASYCAIPPSRVEKWTLYRPLACLSRYTFWESKGIVLLLASTMEAFLPGTAFADDCLLMKSVPMSSSQPCNVPLGLLATMVYPPLRRW